MRHYFYSSCNTANPQAHDILRNVSNYLTFHATIDALMVIIPLRIEALRAVGQDAAADSWQVRYDAELAIRASR